MSVSESAREVEREVLNDLFLYLTFLWFNNGILLNGIVRVCLCFCFFFYCIKNWIFIQISCYMIFFHKKPWGCTSFVIVLLNLIWRLASILLFFNTNVLFIRIDHNLIRKQESVWNYESFFIDADEGKLKRLEKNSGKYQHMWCFYGAVLKIIVYIIKFHYYTHLTKQITFYGPLPHWRRTYHVFNGKQMLDRFNTRDFFLYFRHAQTHRQGLTHYI